MAYDGSASRKTRHKVPAAIARSDSGKAVLREVEGLPGVSVTFEKAAKSNVFWIVYEDRRKPVISSVGNYGDWRAIENLKHDVRRAVRDLGVPEPVKAEKPKRIAAPAVKEEKASYPVLTDTAARLCFNNLAVDRTKPHWAAVDESGRTLFIYQTYDLIVLHTQTYRRRGVYFEPREGSGETPSFKSVSPLPQSRRLKGEPLRDTISTRAKALAAVKPDRQLPR